MHSFFRLLIIFNIIFTSFSLYSQEFDVRLENLAKKTAGKLNTNQNKRIAIWGFKSESDTENSALGNYLNEDFSVYLTNYSQNFEIIDRNHLDVLLKEHKLNAEGYIDEKTAKELGKIAAVDAIVTGTYSILPTRIKLRVKVINTETALQLSADLASLPINKEIRILVDPDALKNKDETSEIDAKNPSSSKISKEEKTSKITTDSFCMIRNYGDFHIKNNLSLAIAVLINYNQNGIPRMKNTQVEPGGTASFNKISGGTDVRYYITTDSLFNSKFQRFYGNMSKTKYEAFLIDRGEIKTEKCVNKLLIIK
jgi:TolB-like protein